MKISKAMRNEMLAMARSASLREDMARLVSRRHNPFVVNGEVDVDLWMQFLTEYNEFVGHAPKPFKPMIDRVMKL